MADEKKETPAKAPAPSSDGSGNLLMILNAVNAVIMILATGGIVYQMMPDSPEEIPEASSKEVSTKVSKDARKTKLETEHDSDESKIENEEKPLNLSRMIDLDEFVVNLSTVGVVAPRYARVKISLEVSHGDLESELNRRMPIVRNTIIDLFNSKRPADIITVEGQTSVKLEIKKALEKIFPAAPLDGVYFTSFAIAS
jgi:flagellar basal body-associated protein FliL